MFELLSIILIASIIGIIVSVGAIIFSVISKKPNALYIRIAAVSVIIFVIATAGLLITGTN